MTECCDQLSARCQLQGLALHTSRPARLEPGHRLAGSDSLPRYEQSGQVTSQSLLGHPSVPSLVIVEPIARVVSDTRTRYSGLALPWAVPALALPGSSVGPAPVCGCPCPAIPSWAHHQCFPPAPQALAMSARGCQVALAVSDVSGHARPEASLGIISCCPCSSVAAGQPSGLVLLPVSLSLTHFTCFSSSSL